MKAKECITKINQHIEVHGYGTLATISKEAGMASGTVKRKLLQERRMFPVDAMKLLTACGFDGKAIKHCMVSDYGKETADYFRYQED